MHRHVCRSFSDPFSTQNGRNRQNSEFVVKILQIIIQKTLFFSFFLLCSEWLSLSFQLLFCYCHRVGETIWLTSVFHLPLSVFFSISPVAFWCALHDLIALTLVFLSTKNLYFSPLPLIRVWWKFKVRFTSSDTFWPLIRVFVLVLGESEFL